MADDAWIVAWSAPAILSAKQLAVAATSAGIGERFRQSLIILQGRLAADPVAFGEVYWSSGSVARHLGVQDLLAVNFSMDLMKKLVLVRTCDALSGHGL